MTGDVVARAKDVLAYGLPISTDLAWALVHEVQRLRAETEGGRTAMTTDPALVEQQADQDDARAVLDAITETHAVIELPEPDSTRYNEGEVAEFPPADRLGWLRGMVLYGVTFWPEYAGEVQVAYNNEPGEPLSVKEARTFAAALLAAARYAESGSTTPENKEG